MDRLAAAQQSEQAAQALHAGTMQKQLSDGAANPDSEPPKIGLWERIFGWKK